MTALTVDLLLDALAESPSLHGHTTAFNKLCKPLARSLIEPLFRWARPIAAAAITGVR